MGRLMTVATCQLNQWALDFQGNTERILESIRKARAAGAVLRVGPELEITGYGCQDHFLEGDTFLHSFESLATILQDEACHGMLIDVGMPIRHRNVRFNCRVIFTSSEKTGPRILLIRPKMWLADDGNFRESRWFSPWQKERQTEPYYLEQIIRDITGQDTVPFGDGVISTRVTCVGVETCEELFTPNSPHIAMGLNGVEIFTNSSGSHHELRKLHTRVSLITEATRQNGGLYLYSNQQGCDGDRLYYDGCAMIILNGHILAQASQFSLNDVEVVTATVDIEEVRSFRTSSSRGFQAVQTPAYPRFEVDLFLSNSDAEVDHTIGPTEEKEVRYHIPEEELALGPPSWLWDYLRRSGAAGFFIPLSGGIDSCATSVMVYSMCRLVFAACQAGNEQVLKDCRRVCARGDNWIPTSPNEICNSIFHTCFMGSKNSSRETRSRAKELSEAIGGYHTDLNIDSVIDAITSLFSFVTGFAPRFKVHGGSNSENLALQNIQARLRMLLAYLFAQLLPTVRKRPGGGGLLVLGSANVDESLRGYLTKYDCSSADINPIGAISKVDLKRFIAYATTAFDLPILDAFLNATPTAELEPISETYVQSDEADMGMTYEELSVFGRLRKQSLLGPWGMYTRLLHVWGKPESLGGRNLSPRAIYEKVRNFFYYYSINRHKMTVLTPAYHAESYSPDDNRFDLRPFLYPRFNWIYRKMETNVDEIERAGKKTVKAD